MGMSSMGISSSVFLGLQADNMMRSRRMTVVWRGVWCFMAESGYEAMDGVWPSAQPKHCRTDCAFLAR